MRSTRSPPCDRSHDSSVGETRSETLTAATACCAALLFHWRALSLCLLAERSQAALLGATPRDGEEVDKGALLLTPERRGVTEL